MGEKGIDDSVSQNIDVHAYLATILISRYRNSLFPVTGDGKQGTYFVHVLFDQSPQNKKQDQKSIQNLRSTISSKIFHSWVAKAYDANVEIFTTEC